MKFRLKITLSMLCVLSILFGAGASALITLSFNTAYEQEKEAALNSYQTILNTLSLVSQIDGWDNNKDASNTLAQLQKQGAFTMQAIRLSSDEATLYESGPLAAALEQSDEALGSGLCLFTDFEYEGGHYLHLRGAFHVGDETLYLNTAFDVSSAYMVRKEQQATFYKVFVILIVVCALLSYIITWLLTRPLMRLSRASRELARGNLAYRAKVESNDEVGILAGDFNTMASQIERGFASLQSTLAQQERFMGSFAHELKTPMTSIIGYAELIRNQTLTPEEQMDAAHFIFTEGKRLESLSLKLLEILANEQGSIQMVRVSSASLIQDLVNHLKPFYEKEHIVLSCKVGGGSCMMEPDLVKTLLINLLDNARKAIEGEGSIHIESKIVQGNCFIRICDNGKGIPAASLARLTEAFYRVDKSRARQQGGVGLGLTLCARIVEVHGGEIRFESHEGEGTCVAIVLRGRRT